MLSHHRKSNPSWNEQPPGTPNTSKCKQNKSPQCLKLFLILSLVNLETEGRPINLLEAKAYELQRQVVDHYSATRNLPWLSAFCLGFWG